MQTPVRVTFDNMPVIDGVEAACLREVEKLERYHGRITSCHVVVSVPHRRHRNGRQYQVRIDVALPRAHVVVNRCPPARQENEQILVALREAFDTARRQIEDKIRRLRHQVKVPSVAPHARVVRLDPGQGYGFLQTADGREVYFHRNSVVRGGFDDLTVGTEVRFVEEEGEQGPQAASVAPVGRHGHESGTAGAR